MCLISSKGLFWLLNKNLSQLVLDAKSILKMIDYHFKLTLIIKFVAKIPQKSKIKSFWITFEMAFWRNFGLFLESVTREYSGRRFSCSDYFLHIFSFKIATFVSINNSNEVFSESHLVRSKFQATKFSIFWGHEKW